MQKADKMIQLKKQKVTERLNVVHIACEKLLLEGVKITYNNINQITDIPIKTLERVPYKSVISSFREGINSKNHDSAEVTRLKEEIKYLNQIIKQLRKENNNLKTELLDSKI